MNFWKGIMDWFFAGNLVGQIIDRMQKKVDNNETPLIPGTNLVLYSGVSENV